FPVARKRTAPHRQPPSNCSVVSLMICSSSLGVESVRTSEHRPRLLRVITAPIHYPASSSCARGLANSSGLTGGQPIHSPPLVVRPWKRCLAPVVIENVRVLCDLRRHKPMIITDFLDLAIHNFDDFRADRLHF